MKRVIAGACASALSVLFVGAVLAQGDVISERKDLMKASGGAMRTVVPMLRGEQPYDKAAGEKAVAAWDAVGAKMATLFPANSAAGDTRALPAIWSDAAGFKAAIDGLKSAVALAKGATGSIDTFRPAAQQVGAACKACHDKYQRPQS